MLLEQLIFGIANALVQIPPFYYLIIFLLVMVGAVVVSIIFQYHLGKYTFRNYKTGLMRLIYISGLAILTIIALVLLALIFGIS